MVYLQKKTIYIPKYFMERGDIRQHEERQERYSLKNLEKRVGEIESFLNFIPRVDEYKNIVQHFGKLEEKITKVQGSYKSQREDIEKMKSQVRKIEPVNKYFVVKEIEQMEMKIRQEVQEFIGKLVTEKVHELTKEQEKPLILGKKFFDDEEKIDESKNKKDLAFYESDYIELGGCNIDNFRIDDKNSVSLNRDIKDFQQLFWDTKHQRGNLHFRIKINRTINGWIIIGVVDKKTQKEMKSSYCSGNAICFDGSSSRIYYGKEGHYTYTKVKEKAKEGMEILVEMNMMMKTVEFNFRSMNTESKHLIDNSILKESNREFVPYIEMMHPGDSISWWVQ